MPLAVKHREGNADNRGLWTARIQKLRQGGGLDEFARGPRILRPFLRGRTPGEAQLRDCGQPRPARKCTEAICVLGRHESTLSLQTANHKSQK
jgi:hypothetical protein